MNWNEEKKKFPEKVIDTVLYIHTLTCLQLWEPCAAKKKRNTAYYSYLQK